jgi:hypothetical protein
MEKLQIPSVGTRALAPVSGKQLQQRSGLTSTNLPAVSNRLTDVDIPRSAWSHWRKVGKARQLRRPLTENECTALEIRRMELVPAVQPFGERDVNRVALALTDMFGGFPSMRQRDDAAVVARIDGARHVLAEFPAWAIEKACAYMQANGVWRDGKFDRQWPPSDAEIVQEVRQKLRLYSDQHQSAVDLLSATVEEPR